MAINRNLLKRHRGVIEARIKLDDVIDLLISRRQIDNALYAQIYSKGKDKHIPYLLDVLIEDDRRSGVFIDILRDLLTREDLPYKNDGRLRNAVESIINDRNVVRDVIVCGGFPSLPSNYVERTSLTHALRTAIRNLIRPNDALVVHGLNGFGKSCLLNQVLQDPEFMELFGKAMFWINLGQYDTVENLNQAMTTLYMDALALTAEAPPQHYPQDCAILKNQLRRLFLNERLRNALLILDDVKCREVWEALDISCRIIVTTQDKEVVEKSGRVQFTEVKQGFSEKESLELLKKSLNTNDLPCEAAEIHNLCDGFPMLINMVGTFLHDSREEALSSNNKDIWNSIKIACTGNGDDALKLEIVAMIKKNVEKLKPNRRDYFHDLAVFPKHVNIQPETLESLWKLDSFTVRNIMTELSNKSLVVSFFHNDLKFNVYSVHSLVYLYLKRYEDKARIKLLHEKLVDNYDRIANETYLRASDNYILGYFGYHLKHSGLFDRFTIYFDLKFIEQKLRSVGSVDLLRDFEIYGSYITKKDPQQEKKVEEYKTFIAAYSSYLHNFPETNIIQYALYHENISSVFETGLEMARNNVDSVYFQVQLYCGEQKKVASIKTIEEVTAICYTDSSDVILVGYRNGLIEAKSFHNFSGHYQRFDGHTKRVNELKFSPDRKRFLSVSQDGTAKLWRYDVNDEDPLSPKTKQQFWQNPSTGDKHLEISATLKMKEPITTAAFTNGFDRVSPVVATGSQQGQIVVWNANTLSVVAESPRSGFPISCIAFSPNDDVIVVSWDKRILVFSKDLRYKRQLIDEARVTSLLFVPSSHQLIATYEKFFIVWDTGTGKGSRVDLENANSGITCADITQDVKNLIVATQRFTYVYNLDSRTMSQLENLHGSVLAVTSWQDKLLCISTNDNKLHQHYLQLQLVEKPLAKRMSLFACHWRLRTPLYLIENAPGEFQIFNGNTALSDIDPIYEEITCTAFSMCGNNLLFGCKSGKVIQYNYKNRTATFLHLCEGPVVSIQCMEGKGFNETWSYNSSDSYNGTVIVATATTVAIIEETGKKQLPLPENFAFFFLHSSLVIVRHDCNITMLEETGEIYVIPAAEKQYQIKTVDLHKETDLIAFAYVDKEKHYYLQFVQFRSTKLPVTIGLRAQPTCTKFSSTGKILATGMSDGTILVVNTENNQTTWLRLHKKPVQFLLFAPSPDPILVSLGDQVAWWDLKEFQNGVSANGSLRRRFQLLNINSWCNKRVSDQVPYLLACTTLHGKELKFISASQDFNSFLVVDKDGNIYKLDVVGTEL